MNEGLLFVEKNQMKAVKICTAIQTLFKKWGRKVTNQRQKEVAKKKPSQWYVCLRRSESTFSAYLCCVVLC